MGKVLDGVDAKLAAWLEAQPMFFVATAPLSGDGLVNLSPTGLSRAVAFTDRRPCRIFGEPASRSDRQSEFVECGSQPSHGRPRTQ